MWSAVLCLFLGTERVEILDPEARIDPTVLRAGIDARLGPHAEAWNVIVHVADTDRVDVELRPSSGSPMVRTLTLTSETPEGRARELATAVVVLIENPDTSTPAPAVSRDPHAWIGVGPRLGANWTEPAAFDAGLGVDAGGWALSERIQPWGGLSWARSSRGNVVAHGIRGTVGLAAGASLAAGRVWLGGGGQVGALVGMGSGRARGSAWSASLAPLLVLHVRGNHWDVMLRTGPEWLVPSLWFAGPGNSGLAWGSGRFSFDLRVGWLWRR